MKDLMKNSIHIPGRIVVCRPQYREEDTIDVSDLKVRENSYRIRRDRIDPMNSTICFIFDHEVYVTPYTDAAIEVLEKAGLEEEYFRVPFSNYEYPKEEKEKWFALLDEARKTNHDDYEKKAAEHSDRRGLGRLCESTMKRCFRIPREGVLVAGETGRLSVIYPFCTEFEVDFNAKEQIGRFAIENNTVMFVYRDGHTYVTKGYWIVDELRKAGYLESDMFVPFSDDERIQDPELLSLWKQTVGVGQTE